jgi:hypothetical protein
VFRTDWISCRSFLGCLYRVEVFGVVAGLHSSWIERACPSCRSESASAEVNFWEGVRDPQLYSGLFIRIIDFALFAGKRGLIHRIQPNSKPRRGCSLLINLTD